MFTYKKGGIKIFKSLVYVLSMLNLCSLTFVYYLFVKVVSYKKRVISFFFLFFGIKCVFYIAK